MNNYFYTGLFAILWLFLAIPTAKASERHEIVWRNLEEFKAGGWYSPYPESHGEGVHFDKPSQLRPDLSPLDANSTHGVWTSQERNVTGVYNNFWIDFDRLDFERMYWATLTVKFFYIPNERSPDGPGIGFVYCNDGSGFNDCIGVRGNDTREMGWYENEFRVHLYNARALNRIAIYNTWDPEVTLLDEVKYTYLLNDPITTRSTTERMNTTTPDN